MHKVLTIFVRDFEGSRGRLVSREPNPACQWVFDGEGVATRKWDGASMMCDPGGHWWARRTVKPDKHAPPNFLPVETDDVTGTTFGWEPINQSSWLKLFTEAHVQQPDLGPGTYELCGPKVNGNPEQLVDHLLLRHGRALLSGAWEPPREFDALSAWLFERPYLEGIVWWRVQGDPAAGMAKIKRKDFALAGLEAVR